RLREVPQAPEVLVSSPAGFQLERYLASTLQRVMYLVGVVSNAIEWRATATASATT
ncbi:MAG: hypothetical protein HY901_31225, partial [Deltaproteobacteria bacterium]|nr:hypothetical protein [Deltaproteobacteria bacterium]